MLSQRVQTELLQFREAQTLETFGESRRRKAERYANSLLEPAKPLFGRRFGRIWEAQPQLKAAPNRAIKQLWMIACGDNNHRARQGVDLKE